MEYTSRTCVRSTYPRPVEQDDGSLVRRKRDDRPSLAQRAPLPTELDDRPWSQRRPLNHEKPDHVPTRPQGDLPVIVRLLWGTHEELMPARAIRWTDTHVMVVVRATSGPSNQHELIAWLRAEDVYRTIPRRPLTRW